MPARGAHACAFGATPEEQFDLAAPFLKAGLSRGDKCSYFAHETSVRDVQRGLQARGVPLGGPRRPGVDIKTCEAAGLARLPFSPARTIGVWQKAVQQALSTGFRGVRAVVEMTWALYGGFDRLAEYEALSQSLFQRAPIAVLCLYNRVRFSETVLRDAVLTRPDVAVDTEVAGNPDYLPCEAFLARLEAGSLTSDPKARSGRPGRRKG